MRIASTLLLTFSTFGCSPDVTTNVPLETGHQVDSMTPSRNPHAESSDSVTTEESHPNSAQFTLDDLNSIIPRSIQNKSDARICLDAAKAMSDKIKLLTGVRDTSRIERLPGCVAQYDGDGSYSKYFPDGKRIRLYFRSPNLADINVFAPGVDTAIAHFRFAETTIIISGHNTDPIGQLILMRSDNTEPFSRFGDWSKLKQPERIEQFVTDLYRDFSANLR